MIRKITPQDFDFIFELYMHPQVNPFLLYEQMDAVSFRPIFDSLEKAGIVYIFRDEGVDCGMFKLIPQQHRNHHIAYLGGLAIHPAFAGKGLGPRMMQAIIALGADMHLLRIELSVADFNHRAIKLYEAAGFKKEGTLKKYTHLVSENRFIDEIMMAYLY